MFLFFFLIVCSVGAYFVPHLGKLQEGVAAREGQRELQGITDPKQIDEALRRRPSNRFLQLAAMATRAASDTRAATEKLPNEIEPPALSSINLGTAGRSDLEALRSALKTAEANATAFLPRYAALFKTERDKIENYALSLRLEKDTVRSFMEAVDSRHAQTLAYSAKMLSGRADYYRAYEKYVAVLAGEFGTYKVENGQFIFPFQRTVDRYNLAAKAMNAAAKHLAELDEEGKALAQSQQQGWEQFVTSK
ncbi:MAG: hypothetical protein M3N02_02535 [Pseudomonadota bacterium]|nr:hypothetical protein [Pseudomonadota bacterium]